MADMVFLKPNVRNVHPRAVQAAKHNFQWTADGDLTIPANKDRIYFLSHFQSSGGATLAMDGKTIFAGLSEMTLDHTLLRLSQNGFTLTGIDFAMGVYIDVEHMAERPEQYNSFI